MAKPKEIPFSEARQKLSTIVDEVERTGKPVKILRHGKVAAVVIADPEYRSKFERNKPFKLAGSLQFPKHFDIDEALNKISETNVKTRRQSLEKSLREFDEN